MWQAATFNCYKTFDIVDEFHTFGALDVIEWWAYASTKKETGLWKYIPYVYDYWG